MFCNHCGNQLSDDAGFCGKCGLPVTQNGQAQLKVHGSGTPPLKLNIKMPAVLVAAIAALIILLVFLLGGKDAAADPEIRWKDIAGKWYHTTAPGSEGREVFWLQPSGMITVWQETGAFTKATNAPGFIALAHGGITEKNTLNLTYMDNMAAQVEYYFGNEEVNVRISEDGSELTFYNSSRKVLTLQKYPESSW